LRGFDWRAGQMRNSNLVSCKLDDGSDLQEKTVTYRVRFVFQVDHCRRSVEKILLFDELIKG